MSINYTELLAAIRKGKRPQYMSSGGQPIPIASTDTNPFDVNYAATGGNNTNQSNMNLATAEMTGQYYGSATPVTGMNFSNYAGAIAQAQQAALNGTNGIKSGVAGQTDAAGSLTGIQGQQQTLANTLQSEANGGGPNPAQEQYKANLNSATQQAAGTIASTKGLSPALAARIVAQSQGSAGQNAASSAAQLQAQQQLSAQQQLAAQQTAMAGTAQARSGVYGSIAGENLQQQANNTGLMGASSQAQNANNVLNAQNQEWQQNTNLGIGESNAKATESYDENITDAGMGAIGGGAGAAAKGMSSGGSAGGGGGGYLSAGAGDGYAKGGVVGPNPTSHDFQLGLAKGGQVDDPMWRNGYAAALMAVGGKVPGRAAVQGDSLKNDRVQCVLSPQEIVLPRSVSMAENAPDKAAEFVAALMKHSKSGPKGPAAHFDKMRQINQRLDEIKKMLG